MPAAQIWGLPHRVGQYETPWDIRGTEHA
jgi:hypothetical protein